MNDRMTIVAEKPKQARIRLGEELPVFCERCGYSLHGLPTVRCEHCAVLHLHCPECGHHQPINTLRPAVQRILGRARAFFLAFAVFAKLFVFFWLLFAWLGMGVEWSYRREYDQKSAPRSGQQLSFVDKPRPVDLEQSSAFLIFGLGFGMFGRMLLLRWRRGYMVGIVLSLLMFGAICLGIAITRMDREISIGWPWTYDYVMLLCASMLVVIFGASIAWGIWSGLVHVFLPRPIAAAVLEWQSFRPAKSSALARD